MAEHWAVIVVGSKGYDNYRHQADACHAYHVVRRHGIPAENVVLMMYDDVAAAKENPFPGKLFNKPTNNVTKEAALEVYEGCHVDYRGDDVTPQMFMNVLLGDAKATKGKKVLESGPNDRVFVNFVDHGARGFLVFPAGQMLTSSELTGTLEKMYAAKKYKELVFYVEACHSGSMFWSWSMSHINAFVTTAANGWESSWGTYCPPMDTVDGVALNTCLGDLYSVNWMEDSDRTDLSAETLRQQFNIIKKKTSASHVEAFGSTRMRKEIVGNFQSNYDTAVAEGEDGSMEDNDYSNDAPSPDAVLRSSSAVDVHDVKLVATFYRYLRSAPGTDRSALATQLISEIQHREESDQLFQRIQETRHTIRTNKQQNANGFVSPECEKRGYEIFGEACGIPIANQSPDVLRGFSSYSLQYAGVIADLCATVDSMEQLRSVLQRVCGGGSQEAQPVLVFDPLVTTLLP
ncbi:hypothetical protein Poli38472_009263 [Pythium oligandrum]|uniref:legumain n=1 Tax=Pythium oligandrum TaxID=41045 RepID=A0A8K1CLX1_PYTOL|nr:hypothetical protein Poli38472_009263 [Pythium oligandrum]|eukprot:TMW65096.1 hypothetical protein Poli38472_009263 [Pythium oligandrum]